MTLHEFLVGGALVPAPVGNGRAMTCTMSSLGLTAQRGPSIPLLLSFRGDPALSAFTGSMHCFPLAIREDRHDVWNACKGTVILRRMVRSAFVEGTGSL
eukprot:scaffold748_cov329-Pavlova_lutheri.AAC.18